jgi:YCII-related domain
MSADPDSIKLDIYELVLIRHTVAYHEFAPDEKERIFRQHLAYTLHLVANGQQLAAGPVKDSPAEDTDICGMGLFQQGSLTKVRELLNGDPGVQQGLYCFDVMTWLTPADRITFTNPPAPP